MPPLPASVDQRRESTFLSWGPALDERQRCTIEQAPIGMAPHALIDAADRLIDVEQQHLGAHRLAIIRRAGHVPILPRGELWRNGQPHRNR